MKLREIKFRAWSKYTSRMFEFEDLEYMSIRGELNFFTLIRGDYAGIIPLQSTGLKDNNGKEIYEGDILKVPDWYDFPENTSRTYNNQVVTFENCSFCLDGASMNEDYEYISEECEVIGNIYEK